MSFHEFLGGPLRFETEFTRPVAAAATSAVFIDVTADVTEANISRGGSKVPNLTLDPDIVGGLLGDSPTTTFRYKVLTQSVAVGQAVEKGTVVNVTIGFTQFLPIDIVGGVLADFAGRSIGELYAPLVGGNAEVKRILGRKQNAVDLTAAEKTTLVAALGQNGVTVDPDDDEAVAGAFLGLQTLNLFGG